MNNRTKQIYQNSMTTIISNSIFMALLTLLLQYPTHAQHIQWELQDSVVLKGQYPASFSSIDCADSMNCIATGALGNVYSILHKTSDGGKSWKTIMLDTSEVIPVVRIALRLRTIKFLTSTIALITTDSGAILRSSDAGVTWTRIETGTKSDLVGIKVLDAAHVAVVGQPTNIFITSDSGKTWQILPPPIKPEFSNWGVGDAVMTSPNSIVVTLGLFDDWKIFVQDDITKPWPEPQDVLPAPDLFFLNKQNGWAVGKELVGPEHKTHNVIQRTEDGGRTWRKALDDSITPVFGLSTAKFIDRNHGAAIGFFGKVLLTSDGGETWQANNILKTNFIDFAYPTPHQLRIATVFGQIFLGKISQQSSVDEDAIASSVVKIIPNPASNSAVIQFDDAAEQITTITIVDALGREKMSFANEQRANQITVDTQGLPAGQYFVVLQANGKTVKQPMMVVR